VVTSINKPLFPYDIAFTGEMGKLGRAGEQVAATPVDYSRSGGAAFQKRGDMYASLASAAADAAARRQSSEMDRTLAWNRASRAKRAETQRMESGNIANLVSGLASLGGLFGRGVGESAEGLGLTGEKSKAELTKKFGTDFDRLLEEGMIREMTQRAPLSAEGLPLGSATEGWRESKLFPRRGVIGTGQYRYTPKYMFQPDVAKSVLGKMHEGPYWWEGEGSTGGFGR